MTYILPICVKDTALFGAALEWLSYEGFRLVRPACIETTMKYKAARDERMADDAAPALLLLFFPRRS